METTSTRTPPRLENPGLLLKACADLKLNIKMIATGSSQLEIRSKVQEYLTGRHLEALILPLSYEEIGAKPKEFQDMDMGKLQLVYGCYPAVIKSTEKALLLRQIYQDYITKDIIEILKVGKPDAMQKLITLIAHSSGQLVNYNQLATECSVSTSTNVALSFNSGKYLYISTRHFVCGNKTKRNC